MPKISKQKKDKISEQILLHLFSVSPEAIFTNKIAEEIARDEEFTKSILSELSKKGFVSEIKKSPTGEEYLRRQRWRISDSAFKAYFNHQ